jgi:hypothetical protein
MMWFAEQEKMRHVEPSNARVLNVEPANMHVLNVER